MSQQVIRNPSEVETTPLLRQTSTTSTQSQSKHQSRYCQIPFTIPGIALTTLIPILGLLTVFLNEAEFYIKGPAQLRAIEALACLEYFASLDHPLAKLGRNIPELECKLKPIQERVAALNGATYVVRMGSGVIGGFIVLQWFKAGRRRPVLILHKVNIFVSNLLLFVAYYGYPTLPIWLITLTGVTGLVGGNYDLGVSTLFAAYADIIPDATKRSNLIFITTSLQYAAQAICLPLTGKLMSLDGNGGTPQVSFFVAIGCTFSVMCLNVFFFPETFNPESNQRNRNGKDRANPKPKGIDSESSPAEHVNQDQEHLLSHEDSDSKQPQSTTSDGPFHVLRKDFGIPRIILLLLATLCGHTSTRLIDLYGLLQYPSIKFKWTVSKTTWLICMQAIISFIVFLFVLPAINKTCQKRFGISAKSTSIGIVVTSSFVLTACSVLYGLPETTSTVFIVVTVFYTLGSGITSALQTYTVNVASSPRSSAAALMVLSIAGTGGKVAASAIWPTTLALGLEHPSGKLGGLPFFVDAVLFVIVAITICFADWVGKAKR